MTHTYPHTVESGSGETLTFLRLVPTKDGDRLEVEGYAEPGVGVPLHVHRLQEEGFTVHVGTMGYQVDDGPAQYLQAGETAVFPAGSAHRWWNAGSTRLYTSGWMLPADNAEYFLASIFESRKRSGGHAPSLFDAAFLLTRYRSEFDILEIPALLKKIAFPVLLAVGKMFGRYERFAGAPEPIPARAL